MSTVDYEQLESGQSESGDRSKLYGILAEFEDVDTLLSAAHEVRDAGYTHWDVHTPFPVHGLDRTMRVRPTRLPWIVLACGLFGLFGGLGLTWWTNAVNYPFVISGKPIFSLPANVPVIFETTVLFSAFGAVFGMLLLNLLPRLYHPLFRKERFRRVTSDRFFIVIEQRDPLFDRERVASSLLEAGATAVEEVED
jgi:hypothetical protein